MSINARTDRDRILNLYLVNREKLFDALNKMSNEQLAESITLWCDECPARESCVSRTVKDFSCTRFLKRWLNEKDF